jgi:hypothetical protein
LRWGSWEVNIRMNKKLDAALIVQGRKLINRVKFGPKRFGMEMRKTIDVHDT